MISPKFIFYKKTLPRLCKVFPEKFVEMSTVFDYEFKKRIQQVRKPKDDSDIDENILSHISRIQTHVKGITWAVYSAQSGKWEAFYTKEKSPYATMVKGKGFQDFLFFQSEADAKLAALNALVLNHYNKWLRKKEN